MFQDYALFPSMTVEQNIMAGMGRKPDKAKVTSYIEKFRLIELEKHYPSELSGGQKQRVAMARMLAAQPEVILLDEPFSALDSYLKWELEQEMKKMLQEVGKPALFVSHNRDEVYRLCDMVSCINQGKMEVIEEVHEFFRTQRHGPLQYCPDAKIYRMWKSWMHIHFCKRLECDFSLQQDTGIYGGNRYSCTLF